MIDEMTGIFENPNFTMYFQYKIVDFISFLSETLMVLEVILQSEHNFTLKCWLSRSSITTVSYKTFEEALSFSWSAKMIE